MFSITTKGDFRNTERLLKKYKDAEFFERIEGYAEKGRQALADATPKRTGKTAASWQYEIRKSREGLKISYYNTNQNKGVNIAVILQFGHGTGWGGYVQGRDYINPAIRPVFDEIAEAIWKEVTEE